MAHHRPMQPNRETPPPMQSKGQATHPKPWVRRMAERRGLRPPEKTLYWWSVHLERFLNFCRKAGREASEMPEVAAKEFLRMIAGTGANAVFASEQARQALDVFVQEIENWHWTEREGERPGPAFRMKASASAGRAAELAGVWLPDALAVKCPKQLPNGAGSGFFHPGASAPIRGPACAVATMCMRTGSARRWRRLANAPGSTSRSRPTRCGIASPRICWRPGPTSGPCRNCSATRASRPR